MTEERKTLDNPWPDKSYIAQPRGAFKSRGGNRFYIADLKHREKFYDSKPEWSRPKYLVFIRRALEAGYKVKLYEAQRTVSKYVLVRFKKWTFRVRFSNHKPNYEREKNGDCDFFVGVTHLGITTHEDAWKEMEGYFERQRNKLRVRHGNKRKREQKQHDSTPADS